MNWLSWLFAIGAGSVNPAQVGANAQLHKSLHDPFWSGIWIYISGLVCMLFLLAIGRPAFPGSNDLAQTPWWAWTGGLLSIPATMAGLTLAQKMGSGTYTGLSITAATVTSIVFDHFGLMGFKVHPASPLRIAGGGIMILGLWLVAKF